MNAEVRQGSTEIEPHRLRVPEAAWWRLRQRLGHAAATGECLTAGLSYGVAPEQLRELVEYFCDSFELEQQPLCRLPLFTTQVGETNVCFVHARSSERGALPLLLLHGYSGSLAEFQDSIEPLTHPLGSGPTSRPAFHVVCPALSGFGLSSGAADAQQLARTCAEVMARLGYSRYLVHGSDLGANVALELAALDLAHVAGAHVTALPAFPSESQEALSTLTSAEKSQLARLTELYDELWLNLPESPLEQLAFALSRIDDVECVSPRTRAADALLTSIVLGCIGGDATARAALYRESRLTAAPASQVPLSVHAFPLDAPLLRRFATAQHRVVEWMEHEAGGCMPALEAPELFRGSLRDFFAPFS
jgi:pimeloyl-ACP methyl ester carboxylesterase